MANAAVFLLLGFTVNLESMIANAWPSVVAIVMVLLARFALLLVPGAFLRDHHLVTTKAERIVLAWSGLRGALTITLVLALPVATPLSRRIACDVLRGGPVHARRPGSDAAAAAAPPGTRADFTHA